MPHRSVVRRALRVKSLTTETWTFPLRQIPDDELAAFDLPCGIATGYSDGRTDVGDRFGTNISIYVDDKPTPGVDIRVRCGWSVGDKREGKIRRRLKLPFGQSFKKKLNKDVTVTATFVITPQVE